jgi:ribose transport system ATP-binding protein
MGATHNGHVLEMRNISKSFPGVKALDSVNFTLKRGEVHVLIGENGAGKSTLIKILSGAYTADSGEIYINGSKVEINNPRTAIGLGVAVIYQELNLNPFTPIYENVFLGREFTNRLGWLNTKKAITETKRLIEQCGLDVSPKTAVKSLGVGQQQLVEIAKAISMNAQVLVFDEPTSALSDKEIERLFNRIRQLKAEGCGIIYISHRLKELFEIGDRCTVLRDGQYIGTRQIESIQIADLVKMVVGREFNESSRTERYAKEVEVLRVEDLSLSNLLYDISFSLKKGEILGVAGLMGSGRTELAKCILGEYRKSAGRVFLNGRPININNVNHALKEGIVYLSEDRKKEGLFLKHHVKKNITISSLGQIVRAGLLNSRKEETLCSQLKDKLRIKTPSLDVEVRNLSGGNQQKVVIAKWLLSNASIFIFDEPTRGIDVGAKDEIHKIMEELVREGACIIMISSEFPEILKMSDRIMVMHLGRVEAILENSGLNQEDVFRYAIGAHKFTENGTKTQREVLQ